MLGDGEGTATTVEVTSGRSQQVVDALAGMVETLGGADVAGEGQVEELLGLTRHQLRADTVLAAAVSALRSAAAQFAAARSGMSLHRFLGAEATPAVELYANINRALRATDRTPDAFERGAARAAREGFEIFKCAPFDEVSPTMAPERMLHQAKPGLERVRAVRRAIGPDARLLVDCHSRFSADAAPAVARELATLDVGWFEEPVQPRSASDDLATIARDVPLPVAGGESGYGVEFFDGLLDDRAVAVVMPDVKYCGGVAEAVRDGPVGDRTARGSFAAQPVGTDLAAGQRSRHGRGGRRPAAGACRPRGRLARRPDRAGRADRGRPAVPVARPGTGRGAERGVGAALRPALDSVSGAVQGRSGGFGLECREVT